LLFVQNDRHFGYESPAQTRSARLWAFAGVEAYGSAEGGWEIAPGRGAVGAMLHPSEMVLPADIAGYETVVCKRRWLRRMMPIMAEVTTASTATTDFLRNSASSVGGLITLESGIVT
jgi:hypothetical protein